ncbi:23S rRNA (uracil(1939)-C(5))-methyltransferase RlmD [Candidatus Uhrbacteria bacterium]|jgi:tRNA (uracil-5-)-methyltransferase|nr:23S rRNA (uracil(1939)-C(5))-methyltransferase RlmD [Candidatus Uhrbacteria bacterium]
MATTSKCPKHEVCGSCKWSHIPYKKQLKQKLSDINGSLAIKKLDLKCTEILPSPVTDHYRNRMDFVINFEGLVGMREKGKWWRVIDNHTCFLSDEKIENLFSKIHAWSKSAGLSYFDRKSHVGLLRYAVVRSTSTGETLINIITSDPSVSEVPEDDKSTHKPCVESEEDIRAVLENLQELAGPTTLIWTTNATISDVSFGEKETVITGPGYLTENINGVSYRISPQSFFQTNLYAAPLLQETVVGLIDEDAKTVLDLYCGSGFFSLPIAQKVDHVTGVELNEFAIADAKINAEQNKITNVEFFSAKTESLKLTDYKADTIVVDPPRSGMHDDALASLMETGAKQIIYISCSYKNLARELVTLTEKYEVADMLAIDMFPHTPHVEVVCNLRLK